MKSLIEHEMNSQKIYDVLVGWCDDCDAQISSNAFNNIEMPVGDFINSVRIMIGRSIRREKYSTTAYLLR